MQKEIKQTWQFKQPPEEVWEFLTKPELIELWLMKTDFQPIAGRQFHFTFASKNDSQYEGIVNCEVLEVKPYTKLSYTWNGHTKGGGRNFNSIVVWTLIPTNDGTELQLQHNGFTLLEDIDIHTSGWKSCLTRFEELINAQTK